MASPSVHRSSARRGLFGQPQPPRLRPSRRATLAAHRTALWTLGDVTECPWRRHLSMDTSGRGVKTRSMDTRWRHRVSIGALPARLPMDNLRSRGLGRAGEPSRRAREHTAIWTLSAVTELTAPSVLRPARVCGSPARPTIGLRSTIGATCILDSIRLGWIGLGSIRLD